MEVFKIGCIIKKQRVELGLTQEQLCEGICEPSTLSKIENGRQVPRKANLDLLMQRLGLPEERYYGLVSDSDFKTQELEYEIQNANDAENFSAALKLIKALENAVQIDDGITRQFILRAKTISGKPVNDSILPYSNEDKLAMLLEAIRCTAPKIDLENIGRNLLGFEEVKILMDIAIIYSAQAQHDHAIDMYKQLLEYTEKHYLPMEKEAEVIPSIAYNYSRELGLLKQPDESLQVSELGRKYCIKYGNTRLLGALIVNQSCCLYDIGKIEEGKEKLIEAFYILKAMEEYEDMKIVQEYANETYRLSLS
jgi:Helix-turn-helix.